MVLSRVRPDSRINPKYENPVKTGVERTSEFSFLNFFGQERVTERSRVQISVFVGADFGVLL